MIKTAITSLLIHPDRETIALEVEEELRFHLEMAQNANTRKGMSVTEAAAESEKRFGNLERIKRQCIKIRSRNRPLLRVLKASLIVLVLIGLAVRFLATDYKVARIGGTLIMIAISARLLLYARSFTPSSFFKRNVRHDTSLDLMSD